MKTGNESYASIVDSTPSEFIVSPRMAENVVIIDVYKDGRLVGTIVPPVSENGIGAFYSGIHASKDGIAELLTAAFELGQGSTRSKGRSAV